jgi:hypothetical protein
VTLDEALGVAADTGDHSRTVLVDALHVLGPAVEQYRAAVTRGGPPQAPAPWRNVDPGPPPTAPGPPACGHWIPGADGEAIPTPEISCRTCAEWVTARR